MSIIFMRIIKKIFIWLRILPPDEIFYLAVPYSSPSAAVLEERFQKVNLAATKLMKMNHIVFSPITSNHNLAITGNLPCSWTFWKCYDTAFLRICSKLIVLKLEGWEKSIGVTEEIKIAKSLGIPIEFLEENFIN